MSNGMSFAYFSSLPRLFVTFPSYAAREPHLIAISLFYNINHSVICSTHFCFVRSTTCFFSLYVYGTCPVNSPRPYIIFYVAGFTPNASAPPFLLPHLSPPAPPYHLPLPHYSSNHL